MKSKTHDNKTQKLRKHSRALKLLSAIASGAVNVALDAGKASALPRTSITRLLWNKHPSAYPDVEIDLERIFNDVKEQYQYRKALQKLQKRRLAKLVKRGGKHVLIVTKDGKRELYRYTLETLAVEPEVRWDKKWRVVLFDIPEKRRSDRAALRHFLKRLGFLQFQKSAFVIPYPCENELDVLIQYLHIENYVTFFTSDSLGYQEIQALRHFKLSR